MKPLLAIITTLIFTLANLTVQPAIISGTNNVNSDLQNKNYYKQKVQFSSEDLFYIDCTSCHGGNGTGGNNLVQLVSNFDASLTVHKENHPQFVESLQIFLETHDEDEASEKHVNYQKVVDFVAEL